MEAMSTAKAERIFSGRESEIQLIRNAIELYLPRVTAARNRELRQACRAAMSNQPLSEVQSIVLVTIRRMGEKPADLKGHQL